MQAWLTLFQITVILLEKVLTLRVIKKDNVWFPGCMIDGWDRGVCGVEVYLFYEIFGKKYIYVPLKSFP